MHHAESLAYLREELDGAVVKLSERDTEQTDPTFGRDGLHAERTSGGCAKIWRSRAATVAWQTCHESKNFQSAYVAHASQTTTEKLRSSSCTRRRTSHT